MRIGKYHILTENQLYRFAIKLIDASKVDGKIPSSRIKRKAREFTTPTKNKDK